MIKKNSTHKLTDINIIYTYIKICICLYTYLVYLADVESACESGRWKKESISAFISIVKVKDEENMLRATKWIIVINHITKEEFCPES